MNLVVASIFEHTTSDLEVMDGMTDILLEGLRVPTEHDFFKFPNVKLIEDKYALAKRLDFREDLDPLQMACSGFCVHSLVSGIGLVLLSNPNLGVFNWKNSNYLMASVRAAMEFRRDPDSYVKLWRIILSTKLPTGVLKVCPQGARHREKVAGIDPAP